MGVTSDHVRRNRARWDELADSYQAQHGDFIRKTQPSWGVWQIPESQLGALGEVAGKDVLELGCGAGQWGERLTTRGARVVGLDLSARQLAHAGPELVRIQASAEELPFNDRAFDLVFCDHGALTFSDPWRSIPEAARVLRPSGLLIFSHAHPLYDLCWLPGDRYVRRELVRDYFGLHAIEDEDGLCTFQLTFSEWLALFRASSLSVETLLEPRPAAGASSTYRTTEDLAWARRFPMEVIWRLRRTPDR